MNGEEGMAGFSAEELKYWPRTITAEDASDSRNVGSDVVLCAGESSSPQSADRRLTENCAHFRTTISL